METGLTDMGIALLVIFLLVKEIVIPMFKRKGGGEDDTLEDVIKILSANLAKLTEVCSHLQIQVSDLHIWHAPNRS